MSEITSVDYSLAALSQGFQTEGSTSSSGTGSPAERVSIRQLHPPRVAQLYLPNGLLAGNTPIGGSGAARRIRMGSQDLAISGGSIFDFNKMAPIPDHRSMAQAARSYQAVQDEPNKVTAFIAQGRASARGSGGYEALTISRT